MEVSRLAAFLKPNSTLGEAMTAFQTTPTTGSSLNFVSQSPGRISLAGSADWDIGSESPLVTDNRHIVIPLMSFVFGFPVLVITILCVIQQRNKWLYTRQNLRLQQQRRLSTASTVFTGYAAARPSCVLQKDIAVFGPVIYDDSPPPTEYNHRESVTLQTLQQNGILITPNSSGQRPRKQSTIRFSEPIADDEEVRGALVSHQSSNFLHPNCNSSSRSPLLNAGPQNMYFG